MVRIAIIGGGPGGLTLARILQQRLAQANRDPHRVVVYESDASADVRSQGGTLDLHESTGLHALKVAGLHQQFLSLVRPGGQETKIRSKQGTCLLEELDVSDDAGRPEIDRKHLRSMLLSSLAKDTVRWGCKMTSMKVNDGVQISFANGQSATADIVVGADGAWSKVRNFLAPAVKPSYSGISFVDIFLKDLTVKDPELAKFIGKGTLFALEPSKGIIAQQNSDGARVYAAFRSPDDWLQDATRTRDGADWFTHFLKTKYHDWHPTFHSMFKAPDAEFTARSIYTLPIGFRWNPHERITLLGDAAHLMSPFAGEGVNLALMDAALLADSIHGHAIDADAANDKNASESISRALRRYESEYFGLAREAAQDSAQGLELFFSDGAPDSFVGLMRQRQAGQP